MYFSLKIEKAKKKYNIKTYKEIIAFSEGNSNLENLQKNRNNKKFFIEKFLLVVTFTLAFALLALIVMFATDLFMKI